jgi:hypothetical protein
MKEIDPTILNLVLYGYQFKSNIDTCNLLSDSELERLADPNDKETLVKLNRALEWAQHNENYDFTTLLPFPKQNAKNDRILKYLKRVANQLKENELYILS